MFSWLKKLLGTNATSATSSTEDVSTTAYDNSKEKAESVDSSDKSKLKQEDGTNECHDNIDFCNDKPQEIPDEWDNSYIDNSRYAIELISILERVCFGKNDPIGVTIALTGALGSGKSSVVNQVKSLLAQSAKGANVATSEGNTVSPMVIQDQDIELLKNMGQTLSQADSQSIERLIIKKKNIELYCSSFRCYWFSGEESLALSFVSHMVSELGMISEEAKRLAVELGMVSIKTFSQTTNLVPLHKAAFGGILDVLKKLILREIPLNEKIKKLDNILRQGSSKKRFLVILDDLDRMEKNEIIAIFKLIKTFGNLRNVVFLLVYDNDIVSSVANSHFPEAEGKYLDKFIQFQVDIMPATRRSIVVQLRNRVFSWMKKDHKEIEYVSLENNKSVFEKVKVKSEESNDSIKFNDLSHYDLIANYIKTPRELNLIAMATLNSWIKCNKLICCRDLIALEILKRYEKQHYLNLCDAADEFDFKKSYFKINTYNLQYVPVANVWYKGATALSRSFENPCLMVLFINGYDNFKKGLEEMFSRTLKATHLEDTSVEAVESLVKAFVLDLMDVSTNIFKFIDMGKKIYTSADLPITIKLDYYIDKAIILIKGEVKHSTIFESFINTLIDNVLELDPDIQAKKLGINKNEVRSIHILDELLSWVGRAICDTDWLKLKKIYTVKDVLKILTEAKASKHLILIYELFKRQNLLNNYVNDIEYKGCVELFCTLLKQSLSKDDLLDKLSSYVILRDFQIFFSRIEYELNQQHDLYEDISTRIFQSSLVKLKEEVINELRLKIDANKFIVKLCSACATYFNDPFDLYSVDYQDKNACLNYLSNEFDEFLKFYNLDPKKTYDQLRRLEAQYLISNKLDHFHDIQKVIEVIDKKHNFSSSENDQDSIK